MSTGQRLYEKRIELLSEYRFSATPWASLNRTVQASWQDLADLITEGWKP